MAQTATDDPDDRDGPIRGDALRRLMAASCDRLRHLARRMLKRSPALRRWEDSGDVMQNTMLRLCKAVEGVRIESEAHYYRLAAWHMRRELIDLARHHFGPQGGAGKHHTDGAGRAADDAGGALTVASSESNEPSDIEGWTRFHEAMANLPPDERDVADLIWYGGLTQDEAATRLCVDTRTVRRRWATVRRKLVRGLKGQPPE